MVYEARLAAQSASSAGGLPNHLPAVTAAISPASSASFAPSATGSAAGSARASDDRLSSILAYIEEAESTASEQQRQATASATSAPPRPVALADLKASSVNVDDASPLISRRLGFTDQREGNAPGSAVQRADEDLAIAGTRPTAGAFASASEMGSRPRSSDSAGDRKAATSRLQSSSAMAGASAAGATATAARDDVTPPGGSKQAQRASELANTVYAGVKQKMSAMKSELMALREDSASLRENLGLKDEELVLEREKAQAELEIKLCEAKETSELTHKRHVEFIDRLLADKQELTKQCENLTSQMRSLEERYSAGEAKREEAYARELRRQKEVWGQAEKAKREQWLAEKTKEIKESTVRGLEPDIQRLVARHREEARKMEEALREEHRRELTEERGRAQRELSRMQEAGLAERHAAQERERELCQQRLQEMSIHFEEQLRSQRARQASASATELEERDEMRRREIGRLEEELRGAKAREETAVASAREERAAMKEKFSGDLGDRLERERRAHAAARTEWESAFESEVTLRLDKERKALEAASTAARDEKISKVVSKLGAEMASVEQQWQAKLEGARAQAESRLREQASKTQAEMDDTRSKYMGSVEVQSQLEARLRAMTEELSAAREAADGHAAEANAARSEVEAASFRAREASRMAALDAGTAQAQAQGERTAMADELAQLRAEQRALLSAHAAEIAEMRGAKEAEFTAVEERVRGLSEKKDEAIRALQGQVGGLQMELHTARDQLHATQQEILAFQ